MIAREHVDNFLRINNLSSVACDADIKKALNNAHWHPDDVTCALSILRGDGSQCDADEVTPLVQIYSDKSLSSNAISSLLRIDIKLDRNLQTTHHSVSEQTKISLLRYAFMIGAALCLAAVLGILAMYYFEIAPIG